MTTRRRREPLLSVDSARVSSDAGGPVTIDDDACPWLVRVWPASTAGRVYLARLEVSVREGGDPAGITAARLARLPVAQLLHVAAGHAHPSEVYYRMLAMPKRPGQRSWDAGHWQRVATVAAWATDSGRPGGPARAVADLWGVALDPTAGKWLARARRAAGNHRGDSDPTTR